VRRVTQRAEARTTNGIPEEKLAVPFMIGRVV